MGLINWVNRDDILFKDDAAERAYRTKAKRIADVIELKTPDRVPFWFQDNGYFPCNHKGITYETAAYDASAWFDTNKWTLIDFDVDMFFNPAIFIHSSGQGFSPFLFNHFDYLNDLAWRATNVFIHNPGYIMFISF